MNEGIRKPWVRLPNKDVETFGTAWGLILGLLTPLFIRLTTELEKDGAPHQVLEGILPDNPFWIAMLVVGMAVGSGCFSYFVFRSIDLSLCRPRMSDRTRPFLFRISWKLYRCFITFAVWTCLGMAAGIMAAMILGMLGVCSDLPKRFLLLNIANALGVGIGGIRAMNSGAIKKPPIKRT